MYGGSRDLRYFVGFGLTIILLIIFIVLIMSHGGGKNKVPATKATLTSYATDPGAAMRETIDGPINAPQTHDEVQITVTNSQTTMNVMNGYDGNVVQSKSYPMSDNAFDVFLNALNRAGFTEGNTDPSMSNDRGYCPAGERYIFEVMENGNDVERFWTTSCGSPKTYKGNTQVTLDLFQAQVPDYDDLTQNLDFQ